MATTTQQYTGDGTKGVAGQTQLTFTFPYLKTEDVKVSLNGATLATTKYTFPTATSIQFVALGGSPSTLETNTQESTGAPKTGVKILFYRDTDVDTAKAVFAAGSSIRAADLNNNEDQVLYSNQEVSDTANPKNKEVVINGAGVPDQGLGKEGDVYIDTTNQNIYGPKTNGAWGSATSLKGATGVAATIDDTPVDGVTDEAISSNWAYDHNAGTGNEKHVPAAGSSGQFLKYDGTWGTPPDTNTIYSISSDLLDEDNMASNSATKVPSQQSVKAYVDANSGGGGATNLSNTATGSALTIESSTGNNTDLPAATTSAWGVMTDEDKTNLDANTAKVTNATHTGDVTGATALTIANDKIEEKHINAGGSPGADKVLVYDSGESTNWKWADQSGSGGGATNLSTSTATDSVTVTSSTGNDATISEATGSAAGVMSTAHHDKLDAIAASANNYSHPNHSGEVTSSGDGATTIASNVVDEDNLKVDNSPTNDYVLTAKSSAAGGLTWAAASGGSVTSDGQKNTKAGTNAGDSFSGSDAENNTLFGYDAGTGITSGDGNVALGTYALTEVDAGTYNIGIGYYAGKGNGDNNVFIGDNTAQNFTDADGNVFIGSLAGKNITSGDYNINIGFNAYPASNTSNECRIGANNGTSGEITKFKIPGCNFSLKETTATDNYVLTVDSNGDCGWEAASGGSGISNVVEDTTPQLGGNLDVQASEITTSTTNGNVKLTPNGTGLLEVKGNTNPGTIQLNCENNSHGVKIKSPPHSAAQTYTLTLPSSIVDGAYLKTDSNGDLSFATPTDATKLPLTGGTITGDLTLDNATNAGKDITWDESADSLIFSDDTKLKFGAGGDLEIWHQSTTSGDYAANSTYIRETGASNLYIQGDSIYLQKPDGTNFLATAGDYTYLWYGSNYKLMTSATGVVVFNNNTTGGSILLAEGLGEAGNNSVGFKAPDSLSGSTVWTLPSADGSANQVLKTDGSGTLSWVAQSGGGPGTGETYVRIQAGGTLNDTSNNTISGYLAGNGLSGGDASTFYGYQAGYTVVNGGNNSFFGSNAGKDTNSGDCTGIGAEAMTANSSEGTTAVGTRCLKIATGSEKTTAVGAYAFEGLTTGDNNIAIGYEAGAPDGGTALATGSNCILIGYQSAPSADNVSNEITLGNSSTATLRCQVTSITSLSDKRDKTDINTLDLGLDFINSLKPVKFKWNSREGLEKDGTYEAGFIAQDFQQVQKDNDADYLNLVLESNPDKLEATPGKLIPILVKAIQELKMEVETLKNNV
tara:strand:+ start:168 stop:3977 length:3810 start_codon:yes stop_codon:yes gene_type:complete